MPYHASNTVNTMIKHHRKWLCYLFPITSFLFLLLVTPSFGLYALCATSSVFEISHDHGTGQIILMPETCLMAIYMYIVYIYISAVNRFKNNRLLTG